MAQSTFRSQHVKKNQGVWTTFGGSDVHAVVARSTFRSQNVKTPGVRTTFGRSDVVPRGRRGTFEEDLHRCIFRGRHSTKDMFMRDVRRSGRASDL